MHKKKELTLDKVKTILSAQEEIRNILSDEYNIWNQQYISLLNVISDGDLYKKITRYCSMSTSGEKNYPQIPWKVETEK